MRLIVLAAGQGGFLDGMVKCLIKSPATGKTILETICDAFSIQKTTVVVGYRAVEIMQQYPHLDYVYNKDWAITNNAYSLGLALDQTPCYVVSSDLLFNKSLVAALQQAPDNAVLTSGRENRTLTAINCRTDNGRVVETYIGPLRETHHKEAIGIFKISDSRLLAAWKRNCLNHGNLFVGQVLPLADSHPPIHSYTIPDDEYFCEINTVTDYMQLVNAV